MIIMNADATQEQIDQVVAEEVKTAGTHILRGASFKPRTSVRSFRKTRGTLP